MWAKNAENVEELLRLDRRVQGVRLEFVAIDSISLEAQWRITLEEQLQSVQYISTRVNITSLFIQL